MQSSSDRPYASPPPTTIWDLLQLMLVVALFSAIVRPMLDQGVGAIVAFSSILLGDLLVLVVIVYWFQLASIAARRKARGWVASLPLSKANIGTRRLAYYLTLAASFPYQAVLLTFAANFRALGPPVVAVVLTLHAGLALATLMYWRGAGWRGGEIYENGVLIHGAQFLAWDQLGSFRYGEVRRKLVLYERSRMRFRFYEFDLPPESTQAVLQVVEENVDRERF